MQNAHSNWVVQAHDLSLTFPGSIKSAPPVQALRHIDMQVPAGQIVGWLGPDGAGKTSLVRLVTGLIQPSSGTMTVLGQDSVRDAQTIQNRISYMPQKFGLYEDLSVRENFRLYAEIHGVSTQQRDQRYEQLMHMTDLGRFADRLAGQLSGGMKQKLGLACTLVRSPDLLLLDEPTVGVDPLSRRELWQIIQNLVSQEKLSVIIATTYLDEAEACDEVFVLHQGQLLTQGKPAEIAAVARGLCAQLPVSEQHNSRLLQAHIYDRHDWIIDAVPKGDSIHLIRRPEVEAATIQAWLPHGLTPVEPTLEDGFMLLLRQQMAQNSNQSDFTKLPSVAPSSLSDPSSDASDKSEVVIEVKDLVRKFGDFTAVDRTNFSVRRGEVFGLLGPNGAGKTTTFRMLCGLLPATSGFLQVAGVNLRTARAQARQNVGYVSQKFALYGLLSVMENLTFYGKAYGLKGERLAQRIQTVLQQFDLQDSMDAISGQLPGGFKQRLAMAVGLLHEPEVLFLDEPTSGTDPIARREFWRRITDLSQNGTTIVVTTHFMEEAEYCDRIVIQDAGKVLALGTPSEVRHFNGQSYMTMDEAFIGIVEMARGQGRKA
ncbi:MAG: ATP-binding cassette domain-containing protein [Burkholderiaceae bacterium]